EPLETRFIRNIRRGDRISQRGKRNLRSSKICRICMPRLQVLPGLFADFPLNLKVRLTKERVQMDAIIQRLAQELERPVHQVENVVHLIDEGNTIPFIARYRKELHGSMDDQLLRKLAERLQYLRNLEARKEEVRSAIEGQGKLNCRLKSALAAAETLAEVEDLYR